MFPTNLSRSEARQVLCRYLNNPEADFRDGQWEAIRSLVDERKRLLVVQRTGWGKSLVYFMATHFMRQQAAGPTLLVSPLLALMRNQLEAGRQIGVRPATINSSNRDDWDRIMEQVERDEVDILLISPERLANDAFRERVLLPMTSKVGLFVVDEAHCISDWGHDFRPDYRRITQIVKLFPRKVPVLATTATANDRVVEDVQKQLGPRLELLRGPLARKSLKLQNIRLPDQAARMAWLVENLPKMPGSGIIYTLTTRDALTVARWLRDKGGLKVAPYYSGIEKDFPKISREDLENRLLKNRLKALVSTVALGMGFDKPDLGFVVHFQRPGSVVHYYQQVGRAGRALDDAYGILLNGREDEDITNYFIESAFPPEEHVDDVLAALRREPGGLKMADLEEKMNLKRNQIDRVLKMLSCETPAPIAKEGPAWFATGVPYRVDRNRIDSLKKLRYAEQDKMREYMENRRCLMAFLGDELNDPYSGPCGRCSVCAGKPLFPEDYSPALAAEAQEYLRGTTLAILPRKRWVPDATPAYGWSGNIKEPQMNAPGRALCMAGDAGWGKIVDHGRTLGRFHPDLVDASARLIRERWKPDPAPKWVTAVPSLDSKGLVPDFAERLAGALGLPFSMCLEQIRPKEPQKEMGNSYHQVNNLDGAFGVNVEKTLPGPALLVDDMVDSRWTFTVVGALLRDSGISAVLPFALATTTSGSQ